MALERANPLGIEATSQVQADIEGQVKDLHLRIQGAEQDRAGWITKQKVLLEQRRGIREKKVIPWVGANNDSIPLTDGVIRRWKPGIMSLVLDADPVAFFFATKPQDVEAAGGAQAFYHWKFHSIPDARRTAHELSDAIAQTGLGYTRQGWSYRTTKQCRIVRADSLFPQGIQAALEQANLAIMEQNSQLPPEAEPQPLLEMEDFIGMTLMQEYGLGPEDTESVMQATQAIIGGAKYIKIYYETVVEDRPDWKFVNALDVVVPPKPGRVSDADFVAICHRMSQADILDRVRDGVFLPEAAEVVVSRMAARKGGQDPWSTQFDQRSTGARQGIVQALDTIEGVETRVSEDEPQIDPIWEVYCKLDINGDRLLERCILWYHPETKTILSLIEYPYPFYEWPIVGFEFEHTSARPYSSRGVAELLSTFQKRANKLHNARLDAVQVLLSPMFKMRTVNGDLQRNIKFRPGAIIPVQSIEDLQPLVQDFRPLTEFIREEQFDKALAEQYIGVFDGSLTQPGGSGRERRTATEVEAVNAQIGQVFTSDASLFQTSMAEVHRQLWQLWLEFGPDEEFFRVTGEEKPRMIRKQDIAKQFDILPAGTPANTNKAIALARAREMIQLFMPDMTGLINKYYLYKNYFDLTDRNQAKLIVRTEQEAAVVQYLMQAAAQAAEGQGQKAQFQAF